MGANEKVSDDTTRGNAGSAALSPQMARKGCRVGRDGLEPDTEDGDRAVEVGIVREMRSHLGPHDLTGDERTGVVCVTQSLAGFFAESRISAQDVEKHG